MYGKVDIVRPLFLIASTLALIFAACNGDDDNGGKTPTSAAATATRPAPTPGTSPSTSPTASSSAAITIDSPTANATVDSPITMSGASNVFEAAMTIDALGDAAGLVLCTRHVQATSGTGTPGTWSGVLAFTPPAGDTPITLRAYSFSPRDGSMENVVERSVTVSSKLPNITITSPTCGQEVSGHDITIEGMALVFEAQLTVDLRDASGAVLLTRNVMAASGTERSPWSVTFDIGALGAGFYDIVAYDHSARDGSVIDVFPVQISKAP